MHSSTIATFLTIAMAVSAVPTGGHGGKSPTVPTCSVTAANKCCNGFTQVPVGLLQILSTVGLGCTNIIGSTCTSGSAACCNTEQESTQNGLVNVGNVDVCQIALS